MNERREEREETRDIDMHPGNKRKRVGKLRRDEIWRQGEERGSELGR